MGSAQSTESIQEQFSTSISENLTKVFNKKVNASTSTVSGQNYVRIEIGPKAVVNCNIDVTQRQVIDNKVFSFFKNMDESSLKTDIKEAVKNTLQSTQSQESASLSLVPYNKQDSANIQRVNQTVKKVIENIVENTTLNSCTNTFEAGNTYVMTINGKLNCDKGGGIKITQDLVLKNAADCVSDTIVKNMFENKQITDLTSEALASQKITVNQWGAIIGLAIIAIILIVAAYVYMKTKTGGVENIMNRGPPPPYQESTEGVPSPFYAPSGLGNVSFRFKYY
jgi:hypothetical protein